MRFAKPLDEALLHEACKKYGKLITVEDGTVVGGFGSAVLEFMAENKYTNEVMILGIPDEVIEHGTTKELHKQAGYDTTAIVKAVKQLMKDEVVVVSLG